MVDASQSTTVTGLLGAAPEFGSQPLLTVVRREFFIMGLGWCMSHVNGSARPSRSTADRKPVPP